MIEYDTCSELSQSDLTSVEQSVSGVSSEWNKGSREECGVRLGRETEVKTHLGIV